MEHGLSQRVPYLNSKVICFSHLVVHILVTFVFAHKLLCQERFWQCRTILFRRTSSILQDQFVASRELKNSSYLLLFPDVPGMEVRRVVVRSRLSRLRPRSALVRWGLRCADTLLPAGGQGTEQCQGRGDDTGGMVSKTRG